jgi:WD40 repeat protein
VSGLRDLRLLRVRAPGRSIQLAGHKDWIVSISFSPDSSFALSAAVDATVRCWDVKSGKLRHVFSSEQHASVAAAFSPDGRRAVTVGVDGNVRLWDVLTGQQVFTLPSEGRWDTYMALAFLPDQMHLVHLTDQKMITWRAPSFAEIEAAESERASLQASAE